jgi:hypothetical protein
MAILMNETNNYYKIEFDTCKIMGLSVYVTVSVYQTPEDREKEKVRRPLLSGFLTKLQQRITALNDGLLAKVAEMGVQPQDITDENGMILADTYPEMRAQQDELIALQAMPQQIYDNAYRYGVSTPAPIEYFISNETLVADYGFDETWVTDPIMLSQQAEVYCGEYDGEAITMEFYYNRLKTVMVGATEDC